MDKLGTSKVEWIAALCLFVLFYIVNGSGQALVIFGAIFIVFLVFAFMNFGKFRLRIDGYFLYLSIFCLFCYCSCIWAQDSSYTLHKANLLLQIFLAILVLYLIFDNKGGVRGVLKLIQWCGYFVLAYAILRYGWSTFVYVLQNDARISNDYINANALGMCAAYSVVINLYFTVYERFKLSDILMVPAVVILAASGSRKALVILIAGIFAVFIFKNFNNKKIIKSILRISLVVLILFVVFLFLSRLTIFDGISKRMADLITLLRGEGSRSTSGWIRLQYNKLGLQLFRENPIIGIGIDNARIYTKQLYGLDHYLHNNYAELAACGGIIGFGIYYSIYAYIFVMMLKYRSVRDGEWDICMIILWIRLVMDYGCVTYETRGTYVFLLLFWLEVQKLKAKSRMTVSVNATKSSRGQVPRGNKEITC